jgi:hypothetical protein
MLDAITEARAYMESALAIKEQAFYITGRSAAPFLAAAVTQLNLGIKLLEAAVRRANQNEEAVLIEQEREYALTAYQVLIEIYDKVGMRKPGVDLIKLRRDSFWGGDPEEIKDC